MGTIVISENVTLDGVIEDPTGHQGADRGGWFDQVLGPDREAWAAAEYTEACGAEALLLGRRTYDEFAARWATRPGPWADRLRDLPKYVASSTAPVLEWENSTVLQGDVVAAASKLRAAVDGEIVVYGSGRLARALVEHDLVDGLRLIVFPVVVGGGAQLFGPVTGATRMRLLSTSRIGAGLVQLTYERA